MYINHTRAKIVFDTLITNEYSKWIMLPGGEQSGKTSFIKEVCSPSQTLFCEPKLALFYLEGFLSYISAEWQKCVVNFLTQSNIYSNEIRKRYEFNYIGDINKYQYQNIARTLIQMDMSSQTYEYANYLGKTIHSNLKYIVLDDFYKCDTDCYIWLLHFSESYLKRPGFIIVLCDFDKCWESPKAYNIFRNVQEFIDIQSFDAQSDYFAVLKENIYFDNSEELRQLSQELFLMYNKDAQLLFKTIKKYGRDKDTNDCDRKRRILKIAHNLTSKSINYGNKSNQFILELLALSPICLSANELIKISEFSEETIQETLISLYNNELIEFTNQKTDDEIHYGISDSILSNLIVQNMDTKHQNFILNRLLKMAKSGILNIPIGMLLELALEAADLETEELLARYLAGGQILPTERRIEYIDRLYSLNLHTTHKFSDYNNAKLACEFGYFETAHKMLLYIRTVEELDYSYFMLLGDVQHLLLHPDAAKTFEKAANFPNITISQKLSAINRKIMSLNQADEESARKARCLYDSVLKQYKGEECDGLIELYRNTNNSYPLDMALEYTIKGYKLANALGNELEKYKCMHNICMIRLHQNQYSNPLNDQDMDTEPSFELVDNFFQKKPQYYHKRAYPLLDLGTYEMFEYISTNEKEHLKRAKFYYSKAQLFAKSFYARHIAEMSLLVTNTHLYCGQSQMISSICQKRNELFKKYTTECIIDHRVNRKILLSLAVSAILTQNMEEAYKYLALAKPYISGPETTRYNNLYTLCRGESIKPNECSDLYYESPYFVPWLISLGH